MDCEGDVTTKGEITPIKDRSGYGHLVLEIKKVLELRGFIPVKIEHHQNRVAQSPPNLGRSEGSTACWLPRIPHSVNEFVLADCNTIFEE